MQSNNYINLDVNAGWGVDPQVWSYLQAVLKGCINPSSVHQAGQKARFLIEEARHDIRQLLKAKESRIIFTSGASESNNLIINSAFSHIRGGHLVTSAIEHISLLEPVRKLSGYGVELSIVNPSENNSFSSHDFLEEIKENTRMISMMYANNETGDLLPLNETISIVKSMRKDIIAHSDAVQAIGKSDFSFDASNLDAISISGHKIGALPGVGALIIREDLEVNPLITGGPQEGRLRAGTENLPGIVSFGYMARKLLTDNSKRISKMQRDTERLKNMLFSNLDDLKLNNFSTEKLPNTLNIYIKGVRSDDLVVALDLHGVLISSAAACSSGKPLPSHVLLAHGLSEEQARQSVRISLPDNLSERQIESAAERIIQSVNQMRTIKPDSGAELHAG